MYFYIICFQIACILTSGVCLYLTVTDRGLRLKKYCMPVLAVLSGIFLMETGYGMYLQETALAGLRTAEKIYLFGKLLAGTGSFVTCVSLSEKNRQGIKMAVGIGALTAAVFLFSEHLYRFLYLKQEFMQNQLFYYIETEWTTLGEIFHIFVRCLPLLGTFWYVGYRKGKKRSTEMLLTVGVFLWAASTACRRLTYLRHYDADMPFGAAFAICLTIFVAWTTKKVYTDYDLEDEPLQNE